MATIQTRAQAKEAQQKLDQLDEIRRLASKKFSFSGPYVEGSSSLEDLENKKLNKLLRQHGLKTAYFTIGADESFYKERFTTEFSHLRGGTSPFHAFTDPLVKGAEYGKNTIGKRSVLIDMLVDSIDNLPSLRGQTLYIIKEKNSETEALTSSADPLDSEKLTRATIIGQSVGSSSQRFLLGMLLSQCTPRIRGWQDAINLFAWANIITAHTLIFCEYGLYTLSSMLSSPFHAAWKNCFDSESFWGKLGYGLLGILATPLHLVGLIPSFAADACRYTRHFVDGLSNFVSSFIAGIGDFVGSYLGKTDKDYGVRFPTLSISAKAIGKNFLYLIPTAIVIALSFIPGGQFIPAVAKAIGSTAGSLGAKIVGWLSFGAGISLAAKGISGGIRKGFITYQQNQQTKKANTPEQTTIAPGAHSVVDIHHSIQERQSASASFRATSSKGASSSKSSVRGSTGNTPAATAGTHASPGRLSQLGAMSHRKSSGSSDESPTETDRLVDDTNGRRSPKSPGRSSGNSGI